MAQEHAPDDGHWWIVTHFMCAVCGRRLPIEQASICYIESRCIACHRAIVAASVRALVVALNADEP